MRQYTRDPVCWGLLVGDGAARQRQPVVYTDVIPQAKGIIRKEAKEVHVNWQTGMVACYADRADAMNHVPFWEAHVCVAAAQVRSRDEYVRETFAYLQRGHSMLEYECQCVHGLSDERAMELGVLADPKRRRGVCLVECKRERRSFDEIARELHVQDLEGYLEAEKMTLLHALTTLAGMKISQCRCSSSGIVTRYLHSPVCCIEPVLSTADDIVHGAQIMSPWPLSVHNDERMKRLLPFLKKQSNTISLMLLRENNMWQIYYKKAILGQQADADICDLWNQTPLDSTMQRPMVLERALKAVDLRPQAMRPAPPPPPKRPKKQNPETNGKKRRQQHYHDLLTRRLK